MDAGRKLLGETLDLLKRQLVIIDNRQKEMLPGHFDPDLSDAAATLARATTGLAAEIRKLEAHDRVQVAKFTPAERDELVRAYLADLSAERRVEFRLLLDTLDGGERLLA